MSPQRAPRRCGQLLRSFWEVTLCQWQKRLDPTYTPTALNRNLQLRRATVGFRRGRAAVDFATTGRIQRPLVTLAGTMDGLLRSITTPALTPAECGPGG